ncbi:hypothetical protein AJ80_02581 [Polytolypa hystricis UAMH7299]|uniref:Methyltransferase domain-containing protein n=1 Tax=Polytolypa hystricis (strain UAMH7299) TaxID=1447883 RepID=A0A2B7YQM1_POLH7|nr:hypothetical protein AJ80_02581 [Polytolypa hystricis UAMH7299]
MRPKAIQIPKRQPKGISPLKPENGIKPKGGLGTPSLAQQPVRRPSPKSGPPPQPPKPPRSLPPIFLTGSAIAVLIFSTYGSYLYASYKKAIEDSKKLSVSNDVADRYHKTAPTFDADVDTTEWMMSLGKRRKEIVQRARGDVLEVSCGTGRNMEYYAPGEKLGAGKKGKAEFRGCRSITFVDLSGEMVEIAREKFEKKFPDFKKAVFLVQDAAKDPIPPPPPPPGETAPTFAARQQQPAKYDTIIQTMGLCSHADPVGLLTYLGQDLLEPSRGEILLLEHGRSHYSWVNKLLDDLAPAHADRHGCWWNRDIGEIVRQSGLEVVEEKRLHLGTTWMFVLRRKREGGEEGKGAEGSGVVLSRWLGWGSKD